MQHYIHNDGRRCSRFTGQAEWRHWDHEDTEPRPQERRTYLCERLHMAQFIVPGPLPAMVSDRGEFGYPGVGAAGHELADWPLAQDRIIATDIASEFAFNGVTAKTDLARRIVRTHLPEAMAHFLRRNEEYGDDNDFNLGTRGQYVDISRKVQKLKRRWWDGQPLADGAESDKTVVMELIGHLLMSLDMLEDERATEGMTGNGETCSSPQ